MPSWSPTSLRALSRADPSSAARGRRVSRTPNRLSRARSSLWRRCWTCARCRLAMSTSIRRWFISSTDSASRWNSARASNSSPRASSPREEVAFTGEGLNSVIQLWTDMGMKPGPSPVGSPVSRNAPPFGQWAQTTPCRVDRIRSLTLSTSSPAVRKRSGRGRGTTSRAMVAATSVIQASTCAVSSSAASGAVNALRGTRRRCVSGSPLPMYTDDDRVSSLPTPKISRPGPARRSCLKFDADSSSEYSATNTSTAPSTTYHTSSGSDRLMGRLPPPTNSSPCASAIVAIGSCAGCCASSSLPRWGRRPIPSSISI